MSGLLLIAAIAIMVASHVCWIESNHKLSSCSFFFSFVVSVSFSMWYFVFVKFIFFPLLVLALVCFSVFISKFVCFGSTYVCVHMEVLIT